MQKEQLMALVSSHVDGDDERFRGVVLQIAAGASKAGRDQLADALKRALEGRVRRARSVKFSPEVGDFLSSHACNLLQGYLFGKPEPADTLSARWQNGEAMPRRRG